MEASVSFASTKYSWALFMSLVFIGKLSIAAWPTADRLAPCRDRDSYCQSYGTVIEIYCYNNFTNTGLIARSEVLYFMMQ